MEEQQVPPQQQLLGLATGFQLSQAIYVAAKLDIAERLAAGPMSAEELASAAGARADMLYRLLRALASIGLFREVQPQTFEATPAGQLLAGSAEGSLRDLVIFSIESHYEPFGALLHTVTTGESAMEHVYGYSFFDWLARHPDMAVRYSGAMADLTYAMKAGAASMYDFSDARTIVNLGGADGSLLAHVLGLAPAARGILVDLPHVVARAQPNLERRGVADRVETVGMNFFDEVPTGDVYLASLILHDWSDDECRTILGNVGRVIPRDGRVVAIDYVVPPGDQPHFSKVVDLSMMATHSGRERTESEWRQLFERSGFTMIGVTSGLMPTSVIEARPAAA